MKNNSQARIQEYQEELEIIEEGIQAYKSETTLTRKVPVYKNKREIFKLQLEHKTKTAAMLQLQDLVKEAEAQMKAEIKIMNEHWHNVLKQAMDSKDKFSRDNKLMVMGIKDRYIKKQLKDDEMRLQAFKTLKAILNQHSNGKSI